MARRDKQKKQATIRNQQVNIAGRWMLQFAAKVLEQTLSSTFTRLIMKMIDLIP